VVTPKPDARAAAGRAKAAVAPASAATPTRPRLKLDPLEHLAERIKTLESTTSAVPLEELVRDSERMRQMQSDMKTLLQQAAKNDASLAAMRERLDKAESERVSVTLVYGLAALLLACLGAMVLLWNRRQPTSGWQPQLATPPNRTDLPLTVPQRQTPNDETNDDDDDDDDDDGKPADATPTQPSKAPHAQRPAEQPFSVDVDLMEMNEEDFGKLLRPQPTVPANLTTLQLDSLAPKTVPTPVSLPSRIHPCFNGDALFDLQQQAEFFDRLGKTNDALAVLEKRIRENPRDCPLLFLELLAIANRRNRKTDFRQFKDEFQAVFNCNVPEFALFQDEGKDLEAQGSLLIHVKKIWPSMQVLDIIEACILRDPWEKNPSALSVATFRDLVVLHGIARVHHYPADAQHANMADAEHLDINI